MKGKLKRGIAVLLSAVMLVSVFTALPFTASAAETQEENVGDTYYSSGDYQYRILDDGTVEITRYYGSMTNGTDWTPVYLPELIIPSEIDGKKVTSIGNKAFEEGIMLVTTAYVTSVIIPEGVTNIGDNAFLRCKYLNSISIPSSVKTIGKGAFCGCWRLKSVIIPESVTSIGSEAFSGCDTLESVTIPESVTSIGYAPFQDCHKLVKINVNENNKNYLSENGVLFNKEKTELIQYPGGKPGHYVMPDSVTSIGQSAFYNNKSITGLTISNGITSIDDGTFQFCDNLISVTIPNSVKSIGIGAFQNCYSLKDITIPDSVTSIGQSAFTYTNITNIIIPDSVTSMGGSVFYGSGLKSVKISNSITSIPGGTFQGCGNLTSVTIPNSVKNIGGNAFYECKSLESVTIPSSVTTIGQGTFGQCRKLKSAIIPNSVTSIGDAAFAGCTSLENLEISNKILIIGKDTFSSCISLKSVTIPSSVVRISERAFSSCTSLTNISIPHSVTSIYSNAFDNCTSLTEINVDENNKVYSSVNGVLFNKDKTNLIKYPGGKPEQTYKVPKSVTDISSQAFYDCSKLQFVVIPETVIYINSRAFGYFYNGSKSTNLLICGKIGSAAEDYADRNGFTFMDTDEIPDIDKYTSEELGALIKHDLDLIQSQIKYTFNFFDYRWTETVGKVKDVNAGFADGNLTFEKEGYYTADIHNCTIPSMDFKKLAIVPTHTNSHIAAIHCNKKDVLLKEVTPMISDEDETITVNVYPEKDFKDIKKYELWQDSVLVGESTNGVFTIRSRTLVADKPIKARIVGESKEYSSLETLIKPKEFKLSIDEIKLGDDFGFPVPDDVPFIGGGNIGIDLSFIPVSAEVNGNKIKILIGSKSLTDDDDEVDDSTWASLKKYVKGYKEGIEKGKKLLRDSKASKCEASTGFDKGFDVDVAGYVEATIGSNGKLDYSEGLISLTMEASVKNEWQTFVAYIPVVVKLKVSAELEANVLLNYDFENSKIHLNSDLEITLPKICLSAGVGIAHVADISVYGEASNVFAYSSKKNKTLTGTLKGEAGVSAKAFMFKYKKSLLKGEWEYFRKSFGISSGGGGGGTSFNSVKSSMLDSENYLIDRSYLPLQSGWLSGNTAVNNNDKKNVQPVASSGTEYTLLQQNVYDNALPKIISTDTQTMMVWTADIPGRTTGNHLAAVYSLYDKENNSWSEPKIISDDQTADFYPDIATDGTNIYAVWVNVNKQLGENVSVEEMASACEITTAKFDEASGEFKNVTAITNNDSADIAPSICVENGTAHIVWKNNANNDILAQSGENKILYASLTDSEDVSIKEYATLSNPVYDLSVGMLGENVTVAYTADTDNDISTTDDIELFAGELNNAPAQLSNNEEYENNLKFSTVNGESLLTWSCGSGIFSTGDMSQITRLTDENTYVSSDYRFISDKAGKTSLLTVESSDNGTDVFSLSRNGEGYWSNPVQVTKNAGYMRGVSGVYDNNGNIQLAFLLTQAEITEDDVKESCDLCVQTVYDNHDITVNSIDYDSEDITNAGKLPITVNVTNNGTYNENSLTVKVTDEAGKSVYSQDISKEIRSGETADLNIELPLPASIQGVNKYTISVYSSTNEDKNSEDNTAELKIGYVDLQLSTETTYCTDGKAAFVKVANTSCVSTLAALTIKADGKDGEVLDQYSLGIISGRSVGEYFISPEKLREYSEKASTIYIEVQALKEEEALADNSDIVYVGDVESNRKLGDVNGNGEIELEDAVMLQKAIAQSLTLDKAAKKAGDMDGNGKIELEDAVLLMKALAGVKVA